jgi:glutaryl-CoA dehydrogenase
LPDVRTATDFFLVDDLLTRQERAVRDRVRTFGEEEVLPIINYCWQREEWPADLVPKLAALGIAGTSIKGHGCPGMSTVAGGLVTQELARADGSVSTLFGVHSGLAMAAIALLGSAEQKERWLPAMARLEKLGAFALTEPRHGSDVVALETRAHRTRGGWILEGKKRWIGNGSVADIVVVWARDDEGEVGGFVVERPAEGYEAAVIRGKSSNRAVWQADVRLNEVRIPLENRLAAARTFADTGELLTVTRQGVAWEATGHALAAYDIALAYAQEREQFGRPIGGFQLVQDKLARMLADVTSMQLLCLRMSQLQAEGRMTLGRAALAKLQTASGARRVVAEARAILGGNGILLEHHVARHHADMEAVYTYEGTDEMQALIVGREITGHSAFAR